MDFTSLSTGPHTLTLNVTNSNGVQASITRTFFVLAGGPAPNTYPDWVPQPAIDVWNWLTTAAGFGSTVAGVPHLNIPNGTEQTPFKDDVQAGIKDIQFVQYNPLWLAAQEDPPTIDPTYAISLQRLVNIIGLQEQLSAPIDSTKTAPALTDTDGNVVGGLYPWDLDRATGDDPGGNAALRVGRLSVGIGNPLVPTTVNVGWETHGRAEGIDFDGPDCIRGGGVSSDTPVTDADVLYRQPIDSDGNPTGDWQACGYFTPDATGRWKTPPAKENGYQYGTSAATDTSGQPQSFGKFVTRQYAILSTTATKVVRDLAVDFAGNLFSVWSKGTAVWYSIRRWLRNKPEAATVVATLGAAPTVLHTRKDGRGALNVTFADKSGSFGYLHSHNDLRDVDVNALSYNLSWSPIKTCVNGAYRFIIGFDKGSNTWKCSRAAVAGGTLIPFGDKSTAKQICAGVAEDLGVAGANGIVVCDLPTGGGAIGTYYSEDAGEHWVQATS